MSPEISGTAGAPARRIDTRGLLCPLPIIRTQEALRGMAPGELVEVLSDDRGVLVDMPAFCRGSGHRLVEMREEGREVRCRIEKGGSR